MSKQDELTKQVNIEQTVMDKVLSGKIKMKPKWYFVAGSALSVAGLAGLVVTATFCVNLLLFLLRKQGPGIYRLELMLDSFSVWLPILALVSIIGGIVMLKKFDFSYKKNFKVIILGLILSIVAGAFLIDATGLSDLWSKKGPFKGMYQTKPRMRFKSY